MKPTKLFFRLLFCTFMLNVCFMNGQAQLDSPCATPDGITQDQPGVYSYSDDLPTLQNFDPVVFMSSFGESTRKMAQVNFD